MGLLVCGCADSGVVGDYEVSTLPKAAIVLPDKRAKIPKPHGMDLRGKLCYRCRKGLHSCTAKSCSCDKCRTCP